MNPSYSVANPAAPRPRDTARRSARLWFLPLSLALLSLPGCAVHRVRADFTGFEKAYADTSNRELLLNLARLQNHDPTYFFKMGQITSSYRMSASAPTSVGFASQSSVANKSNTTGGATPGLSYESDPLFQFIPVNDETNAQLLLKPIPPETFYILYQQGWRIDQLLRVMVDRVEVTYSTPKGCQVATYRNIPPALKISGGNVTSLDDQELSSYTTFLRIAAVAYGLQKYGDLLLRGVSTFVPIDTNALNTGASAKSPGDPPAPANESRSQGNPPAPADASSQPLISATDVEKAAEKNLSYEVFENKNGKVVLIGQRIVYPKFYLIPPLPSASPATTPAPRSPAGYEPDIAAIEKVLGADSHLKDLQQAKVLLEVLRALHDGFTIEGDPTSPDQMGNPCPIGDQRSSAHLVLRSLIGVMAAAAQEQKSFDALANSDLPVPPDPGTPALTFDQAVPDIESVPVLRIDWKPDSSVKQVHPRPALQPTASLIELNYSDTRYLVADAKDPPVPENQYWNRDVFRLIAALTAQVTVDISKYPIANILQLNTQ